MNQSCLQQRVLALYMGSKTTSPLLQQLKRSTRTTRTTLFTHLPVQQRGIVLLLPLLLILVVLIQTADSFPRTPSHLPLSKKRVQEADTLLLQLPQESKNTALPMSPGASFDSEPKRNDSTTTTTDDALFRCIENQQSPRPFGKILDAGTGLHSLRWIASLVTGGTPDEDDHSSSTTTSFTAITADERMRRNCQEEIQKLGVQNVGQILVGNWFGSDEMPESSSSDIEDQLQLESFDVVLADYLIGAMDGFSPYRQDEMIAKLSRYLKPNGRMYIVGLEPIPDSSPDPDANIICRVRQVRDACILLAGHRCYREYPVSWIHKNVQAITDLKLMETHRFPILYRHSTILKQINVGRSKLPFFNNELLAQSMKGVLDDLDSRAKKACERRGSISLGFDYVVSVEKVPV